MFNKMMLIAGYSILMIGCSSIPQKSEPLVIDRVDNLPSLTKDQIYYGVDQWIATKSNHYKLSYKNKEAGTIISKSTIAYPCRTRTECFSYDGSLSYTLSISAKDEKIRATYDEISFNRSDDALNKIAPKRQLITQTSENAAYITKLLNAQSADMIEKVSKSQNW